MWFENQCKFSNWGIRLSLILRKKKKGGDLPSGRFLLLGPKICKRPFSGFE